MTVDLDRLRELARKAREEVPGDWRYSEESGFFMAGDDPAEPLILSCCNMADDAMSYIAAANPGAILSLIHRLEEAEGLLREVESIVEEIGPRVVAVDTFAQLHGYGPWHGRTLDDIRQRIQDWHNAYVINREEAEEIRSIREDGGE